MYLSDRDSSNDDCERDEREANNDGVEGVNVGDGSDDGNDSPPYDQAWPPSDSPDSLEPLELPTQRPNTPCDQE